MKRVNFKRLEIENFLSVGDETVAIDFKTGVNIITGINHDKEDSKNGVGKSTIADALFFGLFGETIRELKKEEIINNINQKKCRVRLIFDVIENSETSSYIIERNISPNKLYLEKNGVDATESSMPKTTEAICSIIGANAEVFKNAVIMTVNGTIPFMSQKKVEKRKFCEGLFNLGVFQDMLLTSRKKYNDAKNLMDIEDGKLSEVNNTLGIYLSQKKKKDESKQERINKLLGRERDNIKELTELEDSIRVVNIDDIKEFKNNISLLETKKQTVQNDIRKCVINIATKKEQIHSRLAVIKDLSSLGDFCDKCKRPVTEADAKTLQQKISDANNEIEDIKRKIAFAHKEQKDLEALRDKCSKAIDQQKSNIIDLNTSIEKNNGIQARIDQLKTWNTQIKVDIASLDEDGEGFDGLISDTNNRMTALQTAVDGLKKRLAILDSVKYVVSEEGVKSFIVKKLLELLNGKLAYYLHKMDAPCHFKFNEYFGEQIINEKGQECSYNNFSSGEKKRIDLAILFTFMDIIRLQGNTSINLAFYDEILDTSLDDKGISMFLEILQERVEKYKESCYIISHKSTAVRTATTEVVFLEKKNGFTTVGNFENTTIKEI